MKTLLKKLSLFAVACCLFFSMPVLTAYADNDLDELTDSAEDDSGGYGNKSVSDYLKGYEPVTDKNMKSASVVASPIVNVIGNVIGFIVVIVSALIVLTTALDLMYIGVPFTRPHLNPNYGGGSQSMGGGMPMGGMGMGMGMRGGMGMGGMGMGGAQPQATGRHCWVSDEAIECTSMLGGQASGAQSMGGMSPMSGMGMGGMGMGMGGMGMGGMGMGSQPQQPASSTKSVILQYFKKRVFFIILFTICLITLTSSIFTDCGINLAALIFKIMEKVNSAIAGVSI